MLSGNDLDVSRSDWPRVDRHGGRWWAPEEVHLSEDRTSVVWRAPATTRHRFPHWRGGKVPGDADPVGLVHRFLDLTRTEPSSPHRSRPVEDQRDFMAERGSAVVAFVRSYGPLFLCQRHLTPLPHPDDAWYASENCTPFNPEDGEPLSGWWKWARRFRATVLAAQAVNGQGSGEELCEIREEPGRGLEAAVEAEVNLWISLAGVSPHFELGESGVYPSLNPFGSYRNPTFLGPLVAQLVQVVGDAENWRVCDQCHRQYRAAGDGANRERSRVTRLGRYCGRCRRDPAAKRARDRRYKRRQRASS